jgi:hypothetical protein
VLPGRSAETSQIESCRQRVEQRVFVVAAESSYLRFIAEMRDPGGVMRTLLLVSVAVGVASLTGCGSERQVSDRASVPKRDLTFGLAAPEVEVASPVELNRPEPEQARTSVRRTRRHATTFQPTIVPAVLKSTVAPAAAVAAAPEPTASQPATPVALPTDSHELPPGKTITIIPASTGSSGGSDPAAEPSIARGQMGGMIGGGHGGRCGGRGRGRGIGGGGVPPAVLR